MGYLELGMLEDALAELDQMAPEAQALLPAREVRLAVHMQARQWPKAAEAARHLSEIDPSSPQWLTDLAYATRRAESIEAAEKILLKAAGQFPKFALIHFNLGCYTAQMGKLEEALEYVKKAIRLDPSYQQMAMDDPDLEPIRKRLELGRAQGPAA
ncbi:MAG: tetratricopeptide repeat protein [Verrucomicrobiae bacterium]|nr:tetratricopeptide repeat protein [Verrucomicrobiae bacterium]